MSAGSVPSLFGKLTAVEYVTQQVHHGKTSKDQRLATRDAVVKHMEQQLRQRVSTYAGCVKAGSQANHMCVRGKRPDFDILFVVGEQRVPVNVLDEMFAKSRKTTWKLHQTPMWYLEEVSACAKSYPGLGAQNQREIAITRPSVSMCSNDTEFDLLPALRVCDTTGKPLDGLYFIPAVSVTNGSDEWTLSFTGREKARFKELEAALPGVRDALKILKYLNQTLGWKLPSIALTSVVWHASEALRIYKWPRGTACVTADKVRVLRELLLAALRTGRVAHMFKPSENVLDGVNIDAASRAIAECAM